MIEESLLIHELQLGDKLSSSVHEKRYSDFSLMLAMLVEDVREHSQFHLPETNPTVVDESDVRLRERFQVPPPVKLAMDSEVDFERFNQAQQLDNNHLTSIKLSQSLSPLPLAQFDDKKRIAAAVLNNTPAYVKTRHLAEQNNTSTLVARKSLDVGALLAAIKSSQVSHLVKSYA